MEEDAGKLIHDRFPGKTAVDLNRAGVPLAEIVSEPDMRSPGRGARLPHALKQILVYAGVERVQHGGGKPAGGRQHLDPPAGRDKLGTKTEVKNMNSFADVERALEAERTPDRAAGERAGGWSR